MGLPPQALTVRGGCSCAAIRYRVDVPLADERPLYPGSTETEKTHAPFVALCHCNHCRRATGAIGFQCLGTPLSYVSVRLAHLDEAVVTLDEEITRKARAAEGGKAGWRPAAQVLLEDSSDGAHWLRQFRSSPQRVRSFCGRCGTSLFYRVDSWPEVFGPPLMDIVLGTVDRDDLHHDWMQPEYQLWTDYSLPWLRRACEDGYTDKCYPSWKLSAN